MKNIFKNLVPKLDNQHVILFIDKNHPPNGIQKTVKEVESLCPKDVKLELVALCPQMGEKEPLLKSSEDNRYPFSLNFLFNMI